MWIDGRRLMDGPTAVGLVSDVSWSSQHAQDAKAGGGSSNSPSLLALLEQLHSQVTEDRGRCTCRCRRERRADRPLPCCPVRPFWMAEFVHPFIHRRPPSILRVGARRSRARISPRRKRRRSSRHVAFPPYLLVLLLLRLARVGSDQCLHLLLAVPTSGFISP